MASQTTGSSKQPDPHGYIHADSDEPLLSIDQSNFVKLMSLSEFRDEPRIALAGFKSRWNKSQWMQAQILVALDFLQVRGIRTKEGVELRPGGTTGEAYDQIQWAKKSLTSLEKALDEINDTWDADEADSSSSPTKI